MSYFLYSLDSNIKQNKLVIQNSIQREIEQNHALIPYLKFKTKTCLLLLKDDIPFFSILEGIQSSNNRYNDSIKIELMSFTDNQLPFNEHESTISFANRLSRELLKDAHTNPSKNIELLINRVTHDESNHVKLKAILFQNYNSNEYISLFHKKKKIQASELLNSNFLTKDISVEAFNPVSKTTQKY